MIKKTDPYSIYCKVASALASEQEKDIVVV